MSSRVIQICIYSKVHKTLNDSRKLNKDQNKEVKKIINL
jgi:hypothetical protein